MKKLFTLSGFFVCCNIYAQNIGIGTSRPEAKLHVVDSSGDVTLTVETPMSGNVAQLRAKTKGGFYDFLQLQKWAPGSSGSLGGINLDNLSTVMAGIDAGALAVGTQTSNHFHLLTNNTERLRITNDGRVGINTMLPIAQLHSVSAEQGIPAIYGKSTNTTSGTNYGIAGELSGASGFGVNGTTALEPTAAAEAGYYAVGGLTGNGVAVGGFSLAGTALRGKSTSGLALYTTGQVRLTGISEGTGKVLTSDASGNATWQTPPTSSSSWTTNGTNIYNSNTGNVGIGTSSPSQKLDVTGNVRAMNYDYATPKTSYHSFSGADFNAKQSNDLERKEEISAGGIAMEGGTAGLVAPVHLPHGSTVTRFTVYYTDNSAGVNINFRLRQNTTITAMAFLSSSGSPGYNTSTTATIINSTINNSQYAYVLEAFPSGGAWPAFDLIVHKVIIEYTVSSL